MASTTTASNLAGVWLGELSSALQGTWQAVAATHGHGEDPARPPCLQQQRPWRGDSDNSNRALRGAAAAGTDRQEGDVARCCGGAMSDTTLYLLLDRFAPS